MGLVGSNLLAIGTEYLERFYLLRRGRWGAADAIARPNEKWLAFCLNPYTAAGLPRYVSRLMLGQ